MFVNPMDYDWKNNLLFANGANEQLQFLNQLHVVSVAANAFSGGTPGRVLATSSQVPFSNIKWSKHSPQNQSNIFIGTQAGKIFKLADASHTGTLTNLTPSEFPTANISSIDIAGSEDTLLVTFSNYGVISVWLSVNAGQSWTNVEANLPDMPVRWGIFHPKSSKQVMLATETGIWCTDNIYAQNVIWSPDNNGMANVRTDMLAFRESDNMVLAATHGRGMFTTVWEPNFASGMINEPLELGETLKVYPNPSSGRFEVSFAVTEASRLSILNLRGRTISSEIVRALPGLQRKAFNLTNLPKGTYVVKLERRNSVVSSRIVIQ